ncbi:MAG: MerR family transcriptional regulator [Siculibacillus sp.]|nr:MerR family transcriptional regulator [Siculibacillus sp.]
MAKSSRITAELVGRLASIMSFEPLEDGDTYTIGQLSAHMRVSLRTLRFYEQSGLLSPSREGLRRRYSHDDRERLEVIVTLRELEVSLTAIKSMMAMIDGDGRVNEREVVARAEAILADVAADNVGRIAELEGINSRIGEARRNLGRA